MSRVVALVGPTAAGKSAVALPLAERVGAEIVSIDSMQVYRGMDIGTAKPTPRQRDRARHHLIDVAEPEEAFSVALFRALARQAIADSPAPVILLVGGSGLHLRAVVDPMDFPPHDPAIRRRLQEMDRGELVASLVTADPEAGRHVDLANRRRLVRAVEALVTSGETPSARATSARGQAFRGYRSEVPFLAFGLDPGDEAPARVGERLAAMRRAGLLAEVEGLAGRMGPVARQAVGYRQLLPVVAGERSADEGFADAERATMRLVKRQRTFFRRDPRIHWLDPMLETAELVDVIAGAVEDGSP